MAALIPILASVLPSLLERAPDIIGGIGHVFNRSLQGLNETNLTGIAKKTYEDVKTKHNEHQQKIIRTKHGNKYDVPKYGVGRTNMLSNSINPKNKRF